MARDAGGPRVRYIGFHIDTDRPVDRAALIEAIRRSGRAIAGARLDAISPWLTRFDGTYGIVRCAHTGVDDVRRILESIDSLPAGTDTQTVRIRTLGTSGTIRALTAKHVPQLAHSGRGRGESD